MSANIRHTDDCTDGTVTREFIGKLGDHMIRCQGCGRCTLKADPTAPPRTPSRNHPYAGSPFRCRDHHDTPVSRKGKGCHRCTAEARQRARAKAEPTDRYELI